MIKRKSLKLDESDEKVETVTESVMNVVNEQAAATEEISAFTHSL